MNARAVGCGLLGAVVFVAIALLGLSMAIPPSGCPAGPLQWGEQAYLPQGTPAPEPVLAGGGEPVPIGSTFIGLETRQVYGPPGTAPSPAAGDRPHELVLDCGDGTFLAYRADR